MGDLINLNKREKMNLKRLFIYMDEVIYKSLDEGNIHFFITINFKDDVKKNLGVKKKIKNLENILSQIELVSWYNITSELNKNKNYHLHLVLAVNSLLGFNDVLGNNIKFYLINNYEVDIKLDVCWNFLDIKKCWRYLYKEFKDTNKNKKIKDKLGSIFTESGNKDEAENRNNLNVLKLKTKQINLFENIGKFIEIEDIKGKDFEFLNGVKVIEKSYNERQILFLWEYFLVINNMAICNDYIYIKINESMVSYKKFSKISFLYDNFSDVIFFFKKNFKFQFDNFDELNFTSKFLRNKDEKVIRFKEFSKRKIYFNFNVLEFKDGIYSILHNKFIRSNRFDKNNTIGLEKLLNERGTATTKYYNNSFENLKEPDLWLNSIKKVLGLRSRTDSFSDKIASFIKEDDIKWLLIYIAYIFHHSTNELNKQNTLYIWGESNTGKTTLIINLFVNYFGKENIGLISNNKNFEYQHLINKNLLIFDEFDIEKINIENFKKLISKELVLGEKKGKEPELISSTPILISSNYNLENRLNLNDNKQAILNRLKSINFREKFKKNEMDCDINEKLKKEEAKIIVYCNKVYFDWIKKGKKNRMDDIKLIEKI